MDPEHENTLCLHAGEKPAAGEHDEHILHSHTFPVFQTSTFVFDDADMGAQLFAKQRQGFIYSRLGNPTVERFEAVVSDLEQGVGALAYGSGMAAATGSVMPFISAGDHVICSRVMYGPSVNLFSSVLTRFGIAASVVDTSDQEEIKKALRPGQTKLIYIETPGNPLNSVSDIAATAELAHSVGALLVVDSTFASPVFQRPLTLGADLSLHSITKYINGHGDVVGGVASFREKDKYMLARKWRTDTGAILGPQDAWLALRGVRTLALRMHRHMENGLALARHLKQHPKIAEVMHPGLEDSKDHVIALKQMKGYGGTFSFIVKGGLPAAKKMIESCHLCTLAVSLGTLDTLIEHPGSMTHASVPPQLLKEQGLTPDLVRISVGLEDVADIIADIDQALEKI